MFDIIENKIYLSRGDSATIGIEITDDEGETYTPANDESVVFTLKKLATQCKTLLVKEFEAGDELTVTLTQDDTSTLAFGIYYYDVALIDGEGNIYTIIPPTEFEIMEVIHNEFNGND